MMLKKIGMVVLFALIFLVGCDRENLTSREVSAHMVTSNQINLEIFPYTVQGLEGHLLLFDALGNEILNEFVLPEDVVVWGMPQIKNGYIGVFGITGVIDGSVSFLPSESSGIRMFLYILDDELNLIDEFEITDERLIMNSASSAVLYDNGQWAIYYAGGWDVNLDRISRSIYVYDPINNVTSLFFELDEGILPANVNFTPTNQLGFNAGTGEEGSTIIYYGLIDLGTKALQLFELDAPGFQSGSAVHDHYALFPAILTSDFQGEMIVLDLRTGNYRKIQLDDYESVTAQIIGNGRLILTRNNDWETGEIRIRVYDLYTLDILFEDNILINDLGLQESEEIVFTEHVMVEEGLYVIVNGISTVAGRAGFRVEDLRFRMDFIIIEEVE